MMQLFITKTAALLVNNKQGMGDSSEKGLIGWGWGHFHVHKQNSKNILAMSPCVAFEDIAWLYTLFSRSNVQAT